MSVETVSRSLWTPQDIERALPYLTETEQAELDRLLEIEFTASNPYQQSFFRFLTECVWTIDEARAGVVRKWPSGKGRDGRSWDDLWLDYEELLLTRRLLMFEKSRRVLASWCVCAFDVWLAAGGQDPRWTYIENDGSIQQPLMSSYGNRVIILAAQKAEGEFGSEWFIEKRIKGVLDGCEAHGLREKWPGFPEWTHKQGVVEFSNGSRIVGVPQGSNQLRGGGITLIHAEEFAFWENARKAIGGALPTLSGIAHFVGLTTPEVGTYAADIRNEKDDVRERGGLR